MNIEFFKNVIRILIKKTKELDYRKNHEIKLVEILVCVCTFIT
jgi:hypothetical protein